MDQNKNPNEQERGGEQKNPNAPRPQQGGTNPGQQNWNPGQGGQGGQGGQQGGNKPGGTNR